MRVRPIPTAKTNFNQPKICDLHMHTTRSDGKLEPRSLVNLCKDLGLNTISITDHNIMPLTLLPSVIANIRLIYGIELDCSAGLQPELLRQDHHLLGYGIDPNNQALKDRLELQSLARMDDEPNYLQALWTKGLMINREEVLYHAKGETPKIYDYYRVVVKHQSNLPILLSLFPNQYSQAFREGILGLLIPHLSPLSFLTTAEAINLIIGAGGKPVLAHPANRVIGWGNAENPALLSFLKEYIPQGLMGIECYARTHTREDVDKLIELAKYFGLIRTAGTDFHGTKPHENPGTIQLRNTEKFFLLTEDLIDLQALLS